MALLGEKSLNSGFNRNKLFLTFWLERGVERPDEGCTVIYIAVAQFYFFNFSKSSLGKARRSLKNKKTSPVFWSKNKNNFSLQSRSLVVEKVDAYSLPGGQKKIERQKPKQRKSFLTVFFFFSIFYFFFFFQILKKKKDSWNSQTLGWRFRPRQTSCGSVFFFKVL